MRRYDEVMYSSVYWKYYNQSAFFNFGYWLEHTRNQKEACENLVEKLLDFLPHRTGTILDVACGMGATSRYLQKYYTTDNIVGINISMKQLESCRLNAPKCNFMLMDAAAMAFSDNQFENIICCEAVFHFNTREKFLHEAYRILAPGGYLILSDIIFSALPKLPNNELPPENNVTDLQAYKQFYMGAGFDEVKMVDATNECWRGWRQNIVRWACAKLVERKIRLPTFLTLMLGPLIGSVVIKHYILVSAKKV